MKLLGKSALITGASGGIGRAAALALARNGADIACNYWTMEHEALSLADEARRMGRKVSLHKVDVSDQNATEGMVGQVCRDHGRLDILVSSAVYSDRELFTEADMAGFKRTIDVSMWGSFYALRASARAMIKQGQGGSCVVVGSAHAHVAQPTCMAYNMAKAAVDQMARTAALELAPHKIRVNLIYPGWTDTPGERKFFTEDVLKSASSRLPVPRLARPDEIARGVIFLVDPESEYITGSTLSIDGGSTLPWWSKRGSGDF